MYASSSPLLDRLLAPSARLMARFRFGQKAMVIGAAFLVTCAILIALRAHSELAIHFPAAIRNGASLEDLEEVIYQAAGYAGFPAAASAREVAKESLSKAGMI